ncbi:MAG: hypothetical protein MHM6MM_007327 [Cercozoa sp. M6MM]
MSHRPRREAAQRQRHLMTLLCAEESDSEPERPSPTPRKPPLSSQRGPKAAKGNHVARRKRPLNRERIKQRRLKIARACAELELKRAAESGRFRKDTQKDSSVSNHDRFSGFLEPKQTLTEGKRGLLLLNSSRHQGSLENNDMDDDIDGADRCSVSASNLTLAASSVSHSATSGHVSPPTPQARQLEQLNLQQHQSEQQNGTASHRCNAQVS